MSNWRDTIKEVSAWYKGLDADQKSEAAKLLKQSLFPDFSLSDEYTDQAFDHARTMLSDLFENLTGDLKRDIIWRAKRSEAKVLELIPEVDRLQKLVGEQNEDIEWQFILEYLIAFVGYARKREGYDVLHAVHSRLQPDWEVLDYYMQDGIRIATPQEIRDVLTKEGYTNFHVPEAEYRCPHSPGGGTSLHHAAYGRNAYHYKGMCHSMGVRSVGISEEGFILGIEERLQTAGNQGVVAKWLRTYSLDPESGYDIEIPKTSEIRF